MPETTAVQRIAALSAQIDALSAASHAESRVIGGLLRGEGTLFGARVALSWPDGLPNGFTEESLRDFGWSMLERAHA